LARVFTFHLQAHRLTRTRPIQHITTELKNVSLINKLFCSSKHVRAGLYVGFEQLHWSHYGVKNKTMTSTKPFPRMLQNCELLHFNSSGKMSFLGMIFDNAVWSSQLNRISPQTLGLFSAWLFCVTPLITYSSHFEWWRLAEYLYSEVTITTLLMNFLMIGNVWCANYRLRTPFRSRNVVTGSVRYVLQQY